MTKINRRQVLGGTLALLTPFPTPAVHAQPHYPERPIRVIVPFAAGGVGDTTMRLLAPRMEQQLGQKLVIESKPGAGGNIGAQEVARARPDGYTVLVAAMGNFVINQFLMKTSFDPLSAMTPVAKVVDIPVVFFSNASVPARNLAEFVSYAQANPGKLNYGSQGHGSLNHLLIERFKQVAASRSLTFRTAGRRQRCSRCSPTRPNCFRPHGSWARARSGRASSRFSP